MDSAHTFWTVTLFHLPDAEARDRALALASEVGVLGVEEYCLDEARVDELLGTRSYSGGDLPEEVLDEVEGVVYGAPLTFRFFFEAEAEAQDFVAACADLLAEIQVEECQQQDWNAEWKKHYSPILVNEELEVVPAWQTTYSPRAKNSLMIHPGMGFGTGSHETTFLCLRLLSEDIPRTSLATTLDFGSGSGILGLAALKLFQETRVDFYDIDPEANKNCFHNAELNGLASAPFRLLLPTVRERLKPPYQLVFANILENILLEEQAFLTSAVAPGGHLILSGILTFQTPGVQKAYVARGFECLRRLDKNDWSALLFRKPE